MSKDVLTALHGSNGGSNGWPDMVGAQCCRVEIKYHNVWGTISVPKMTTTMATESPNFVKDLEDTSVKLANVMCRKAGCSGEGAVPMPGGFSHHLDGSSWRAHDMIWLNLMDMRNCSDLSESSTDFVQCMTTKWGEGDGEYGVGAGSDSPNPHDLDFGVCCKDGCTGVAPTTTPTCSNSAMDFYANHRATHDCRYLPVPPPFVCSGCWGVCHRIACLASATTLRSIPGGFERASSVCDCRGLTLILACRRPTACAIRRLQAAERSAARFERRGRGRLLRSEKPVMGGFDSREKCSTV